MFCRHLLFLQISLPPCPSPFSRAQNPLFFPSFRPTTSPNDRRTTHGKRKADHGTRVGQEKGRRGTSRPRGGREQPPTHHQRTRDQRRRLRGTLGVRQHPTEPFHFPRTCPSSRANIPVGRPGAVTICMENSEIPGIIQMECFIPMEIFREKNITFFPIFPKRPKFPAPFVWITSPRLQVGQKAK